MSMRDAAAELRHLSQLRQVSAALLRRDCVASTLARVGIEDALA